LISLTWCRELDEMLRIKSRTSTVVGEAEWRHTKSVFGRRSLGDAAQMTFEVLNS